MAKLVDATHSKPFEVWFTYLGFQLDLYFKKIKIEILLIKKGSILWKKLNIQNTLHYY